jgi:hypothetical protein
VVEYLPNRVLWKLGEARLPIPRHLYILLLSVISLPLMRAMES